ncbi:MAG: hypothetical protein IKP64_01885, partial [Selenomonadaceae bacterium]|nr:hypothetical protein [Selenomonadaceae bacterium]
VEILNSLNFRQVSFEFHGENYSDDYEIAYRHFDGIDADGNGTCFGLIEIVINGKLDTVRFINTYRETAVDIKIGNADYTVDDKGAVELIDEPETPVTIETKIAKDGAAIVYVNGKRTSREAAVKFAEENNLPTYTATCYPYSERNYSISEEFATALSAYKWIVSKANSNRNVADGSFEIRRYTDGIKNETTIFDHTENGGTEINADDEPEFATFIYAKIGEVHISDRYDRMVLFHNQLANDGLTEEQINQVLVTQYNNENGREHCKLIKEFKAANFKEAQEVAARLEEIIAEEDARRAEIEQATGTVTENSEEKITIDAVIADAKDFIATNLDARTEKVFKLCFGIHVAFHFYLNNLKSKHFAEVHKIESELRNFKTASDKFYRDYIAATDGHIDSEEMTALYKHIYDCTETPYTNAVWAETREIANQILDNLGEETLMRELAKVTDEFGFDRDLLNQSDNCDFKPFNLDDPEPTPEPERTKIHVENESEDDFELYPIDVAIYHGGDILTEDELEDYAAQFREAITANGNFGTVEIGESYLSVWGNTGGDNKTIWKLIGDLCWRGDCALEGYGSKETDYELREMPGEEIDAMLERMGIDNDPPALVIGNEPADPNEPLIAANIREAAIKFGEKFFGKDESMSKFESEDERNARIDGYLNTAYELEGMATELEIICDNFDEDSEIETDRHVASRISFYVDHVKRGIEGLREMIDWYKQQADFAESKAE